VASDYFKNNKNKTEEARFEYKAKDNRSEEFTEEPA